MEKLGTSDYSTCKCVCSLVAVRRRLSYRRSKRWANATKPVKCTTPACRVRSNAAKPCLLTKHDSYETGKRSEIISAYIVYM